MADSTLLGLRPQDLWDIYEAENPLVEAMRRIAGIGGEGAEENTSLAVQDLELFG